MKIMVMKHTSKDHTMMSRSLEELAQFIMKNYASPGTEIVCSFTDDLLGEGSIHTNMMKAMANSGLDRTLLAPAVIKKALEAQENGFDAVVLTHANDTGVEAARFVLRIPMLGVKRASLHLASVLADRIGVIIAFDRRAAEEYRLLRSYGFSDSIACIVAANPPLRKDTAQEEIKDAVYDEILECFVKAGKKCVQAGAQIIIPFCGVYVPRTIPVKTLSERVGVPVIDTLSVGIGLAEFLVRFGLTHSEAAYPFYNIKSSDIGSNHNKK